MDYQRNETEKGYYGRLSHKEFLSNVKSYESLFKVGIEILEKWIADGNLLSAGFCISYEKLLEDRLRFCRMCSEYYRSLSQNSFWFMKHFVLRRAIKYERIHYDTLGRLMQLKMYRRLFHWLPSANA